MGRNRFCVVALWALAWTLPAQARQPDMRVQYAEPVAIPPGAGTISFDAYGRRFTADLVGNDRLVAKAFARRKLELSRYHVLKGNLTGEPRSWVRLTEKAGRIEGAIWDGRDLYVVTTLGGIAANLTTPILGAPEQTVVYRLSDTIDAFPRGMCPVLAPSDGADPANGLVQYRAMVAELAVTIPRQIEISLIGDAPFQAKYTDPTFELLARHNVVDGVYAEQVGLLVLPTDLRLIPSATDPFNSSDASTLLGQVSTFRGQDAISRARGITHLMTGRILDGDTAGIARLGGVCSTDDGVSLTESSGNPTRDGLIMSHELGHNFGAVHDGTGACSAVSSSWIMSPTLNFSKTFSQCSLDTMRPVIQTAQCVTAASYGDVAIDEFGPNMSVEFDSPLVVPYTVRSIGTQPAEDARLIVTAPPDFTFISASLPANCSVSGNQATCDFGTIPAGEERNVSLALLPATMAVSTIEARVTASNNPSTHNDRQSRRVDVTPNADASLTLDVSSSRVLIGSGVDFTIVVKSLRTHATQDTIVRFYNSGGNSMRVDTASGTGANCTTDQLSARCELGSLDSGVTRTITVHATALAVGVSSMTAAVSASNDPFSYNDSAYANLDTWPLRDLGFKDTTPSGTVQYGMPLEYKTTLYSTGPQPIEGARVEINLLMPSSAVNTLELSVQGSTCTKLNFALWRCEVGMLAAGETRDISIKGIANAIDDYRFHLTAYASAQDVSSNDTADTTLRVRYGLDAAVRSNNIFDVETLESSGSFSVLSNGLQPSNVVLTLELPPQVRLTRFFGVTLDGNCEIADAQHLRCEITLTPQSGYQGVDVFVIGDTPGTYQGKATITLDGDEAPANNVAPFTINVNPLIDVGVQDFTMPQYVMSGHDETVPITLTAGARGATGVTARVQAQVHAELAGVTASVGTCTRVDPYQFDCALGDLAGGASAVLNAVVRAVTPGGVAYFSVNASAANDNNGNNNFRNVQFTAMETADVGVTVAASSVTATAGTPFSLPTINVLRTGQLVQGKLTITLPQGASISSVSGLALTCAGTSELQCDLPTVSGNQGLQVDLLLNVASPQTFTSHVRVSATNDFAHSNDEATIFITVNAASPPSPPAGGSSSGGGSKGGGGGGGRLEWLALAVLALLAARRLRADLSASNPGGFARSRTPARYVAQKTLVPVHASSVGQI